MSLSYCKLPNRAVLKIEGEDRLDFLQGLISNDINKVTATDGIYAAFLTPQGKFLCDFFIAQENDALLLDIDAEAMPAFKKKLMMYKLRANVAIADVSAQYDVFAAFGDKTTQSGVFADPRLEEAGYRAILPNGQDIENAEPVPFETYELMRIQLGLPDGGRDMTVEKSILLENGFDELHGVDWNKGCYMGQELTARTKYRALIRKRLFPVMIEGDLPAPGTEITSGDKVVGEIHSGIQNMALATLKLDALDDELSANGAKLTPKKPDWMILPESA
ncbi:glycine cleavage system protein T [Terasakiella brassicae]|uniref:Glycine cleavage system protein T n=1 Tax=Terasakiella brassicae TaxID=1634917 RepID=A0A917BXD7_9PROT|nr:folate-binding protein YgfZ [Terasakiella brassicae]GGF58492.1 glycine cleavage system protein T [Terasakiella brassicae]